MLFLYSERDERKSRPTGVSGQEGRGPGVTPAPLPFSGLALSCRHTLGQFLQSPQDRSWPSSPPPPSHSWIPDKWGWAAWGVRAFSFTHWSVTDIQYSMSFIFLNTKWTFFYKAVIKNIPPDPEPVAQGKMPGFTKEEQIGGWELFRTEARGNPLSWNDTLTRVWRMYSSCREIPSRLSVAEKCFPPTQAWSGWRHWQHALRPFPSWGFGTRVSLQADGEDPVSAAALPLGLVRSAPGARFI